MSSSASGALPAWRGVIDHYREYLPVTDDTPVVTLYEGNTPLVPAVNLGREVCKGLELYLKLEGMNPTSSFKDRGMTMAVSKAVEDGASEIDMVLNIGLLKSRDYETVVDDIARVVKASHPKPVKVILETSSLSEHEKVIACALSKCGGAHFVKTSTGFGGGGATAADVALMKAVVGEEMEVKASGGIKSYEDAVSMIEAGATRIGASASVVIVAGPSEKRTRGRKRPVASGLY